MARTFAPTLRPRPPRLRARRPSSQPMPADINPMLAVLAPALPADGDNYGYEFKWDGIRALCYWDGRRLRLESRNRLEMTHRYPELHVLGEALGSRTAVIDGEIVALNENDQPDFPLLQRRMHVNGANDIQRAARDVPIRYLVFDLLYLDGRSVTDRSYVHRRDLLEQLTLVGPTWQVPPAQVGGAEGEVMLAAAREQGLEGIVAKRLDSVYQAGRRSPDWLKIKVVARQEFVIGGWVPQGGTDLNHVGSLLIGYYEPAGGNKKVLHFAGGVGTGFDQRWHRALTSLLKPLTRGKSPFADPVPKAAALFVEPLVVAEIEYRRWPAGGMVHQAAFKGVRTDKNPRQVVREDRMCQAPPRPNGGE